MFSLLAPVASNPSLKTYCAYLAVIAIVFALGFGFASVKLATKRRPWRTPALIACALNIYIAIFLFLDCVRLPENIITDSVGLGFYYLVVALCIGLLIGLAELFTRFRKRSGEPAAFELGQKMQV